VRVAVVASVVMGAQGFGHARAVLDMPWYQRYKLSFKTFMFKII
jgi:hypothetical protein